MAQKKLSFPCESVSVCTEEKWGHGETSKPLNFAPLVSIKVTQRKAGCKNWAGTIAFWLM